MLALNVLLFVGFTCGRLLLVRAFCYGGAEGGSLVLGFVCVCWVCGFGVLLAGFDCWGLVILGF